MDAATISHGQTSLILPTYDPGSILDEVWHRLTAFTRGQDNPWEILFVCDGCTDGTPEKLRRLTALERLPYRVLSYATNRGKGFAVKAGMLAARGCRRIFTDIDLAYGFADILKLDQVLRQGSPVAIASRKHAESRSVVPVHLRAYVHKRHVQSSIFSLFARTMLGLRERDTQAGLKGFTAEAAAILMPQMRSSGFGFDCELLWLCRHLGLHVEEVPVCVRYADRNSTTTPRAMAKMLSEIHAIWCRKPPDKHARTIAKSKTKRRAA